MKGGQSGAWPNVYLSLGPGFLTCITEGRVQESSVGSHWTVTLAKIAGQAWGCKHGQRREINCPDTGPELWSLSPHTLTIDP